MNDLSELNISVGQLNPEGIYRQNKYGNSNRIASVATDSVVCQEDKEIARRIVACVNACHGMPTKSLEMGVFDAEDIRYNGVDITPTAQAIENDVLKKQNQRLFSCLSKLTDTARTSGGTAGKDRDLCLACDEAESLIAEIRRFEESLMVEGVDYEPQDINIHSEQMR